MTEEVGPRSNVPDALKQWRDAERAVAVAQRGKLAAEAASTAALQAVSAAETTAEAAKRALEAARLAEASAAATAEAARRAAHIAAVDSEDAATELTQADAHEDLARHYYGQAVEDAREREEEPQA